MSMQHIPVIDIEHLDRDDTLAQLDRACRDWGFFQVINHGVPSNLSDRLMEQARGFFGQRLATKRSITRTAENPWGFYDRELTKNTRDWKQIYDYGPGDGGAMQPQWPAAMPGFRAAVLDYYGACERLAFRLLGAVTTNLGADSDQLFSAFMPRHTSFLRLNYYPVCPTPERPEGFATPKAGHLALNHHTDSGALTLLLQDEQSGLEVLRDGRWHLVEPRADALVVNIGDIAQVWSNDRYQAAVHRVLANAGAERFSVPFFFSPAYSARYAPLPTMTDDARPARYRPINWGEFYRERAAGDFADRGEEIQITHYRTN